MEPELFVLLSGILTFGAPLALALWDLLLLRRGGGGPPRRDPTPEAPRAPKPAGHRPLPDCLIPKPLPPVVARSRALEDA